MVIDVAFLCPDYVKVNYFKIKSQLRPYFNFNHLVESWLAGSKGNVKNVHIICEQVAFIGNQFTAFNLQKDIDTWV